MVYDCDLSGARWISTSNESGAKVAQFNIPKLIAFNLPQYHPIPENEAWWGKGFTEWTNVVKAKPLFEGHYQPHLPADLGFYDLRLPEVREAQAALAREYGIHGFCYYHYWFNGHRLLERPVNEIVSSGEPDFPFCLCWANENWTRVWDGGERQILIEQVYSEEDDSDHIRALLPILADRRYIRVHGKPVFLVYRATRLPNPLQTTEIWRREAVKTGLPGLYLIRIESLDERGDPRQLGFDSALEFQPRGTILGGLRNPGWTWWRRAKLGTLQRVFVNNYVREYDHLVERAIAMDLPSYPFIRCVCPGWDNTARRGDKGAHIFHKSSPESYQTWLSYAIHQTVANLNATSDCFLFINAWNEWAEGNHLEPCQRWGRSYLEATRRALLQHGVSSQSDEPAALSSV